MAESLDGASIELEGHARIPIAAGNTVKHVCGPLDIVLPSSPVAVIVGFFIYLRRTEERSAHQRSPLGPPGGSSS